LTKAIAGNPASMSELWEIHMTIDSSRCPVLGAR